MMGGGALNVLADKDIEALGSSGAEREENVGGETLRRLGIVVGS